MTDQIRDVMKRAANVAGDDFSRPTVAQFTGRRRAARRNVVAVIATVAVVLAVAGVSVALTHGKSVDSAPTVQQHRPEPKITAQSLTRYRWARLPASPLGARTDTASVWTGTQMLIWGGADRAGVRHTDGAAWDPRIRTWSTIPPAPLSARESPYVFWTGSVMIVWGGVVGDHDV